MSGTGRRRRRRLSGILPAFFLCAALLCPAARAEDARCGGAGAVMAPIMEEYGLGEDNFSMAYYNTVTGESWLYNEDAPMLGGSVYKLPLAMRYVERVNAGELTMDSIVGGYRLDLALRAMLVNSDNDVAKALEDSFGGRVAFRSTLPEYFGVDAAELPSLYIDENYFNAAYTLNLLQFLYDNAETYAPVPDLMREAQPDRFFREQVSEYPVAQKYGYYENYLNDVGIIYTDQPFLLAVFTHYVPESALGDICRALCDYTAAAAVLAETPSPSPAGTPSPAATSAPPSAAVSAAAPAPALTASADAVPAQAARGKAAGIIALSSGGCLLVLGLGAALSARRHGKKHSGH